MINPFVIVVGVAGMETVTEERWLTGEQVLEDLAEADEEDVVFMCPPDKDQDLSSG